jgi:REP element-mobilizing transposase RayT
MAQPDPIQFGLFDPQAEVEQSQRFLPHWFQPGVATFITFRTADSLPRDVLERWQREQEEWLRENNLDARTAIDPSRIRQLTPSVRRQFMRHRDRAWHAHLDACHGDCVLRQPDLAGIVGESLRHFDGQRYDLDSLVVMPNHVHVLVQFRPPTTLRGQSESWLHYTAVQINRRLGRRGQFWQSEPFDHLVRSPEQFKYLQQYIADNPTRANLRAGEFLFWSRDSRRSAS